MAVELKPYPMVQKERVAKTVFITYIHTLARSGPGLALSTVTRLLKEGGTPWEKWRTVASRRYSFFAGELLFEIFGFGLGMLSKGNLFSSLNRLGFRKEGR